MVWGIWGFMGGFASLYVHDQPYRPRAILLAVVGLGLAAAMAIGGLSAVWWAIALGLGFIAAASTFLTGAFDVPLPASLMFVLVGCISSALPTPSRGVLLMHVASALGGAAIAWGVGMMDWLWDPNGPPVRSLSRAFGALAQYGSSVGTRTGPSKEHRAALAVMAAHRSAAASTNRRLNFLASQTGLLFRSLVALSTVQRHPLGEPWPRVLESLAQDLTGHRAKSLRLPRADSDQDPRWKRWRGAVAEAIKVAAGELPDQSGLDVYRPTVRDRLLRGLSPTALVLPAAIRIGVAVLAAVVIAHFLGVAHPFWLPLTCAAVLQGVSTTTIVERGLQRAVGTALGLILAGGIVAQHPTTLWAAGLVIILQLAMLFFIAKNYGISVIFITALALIIIYSETHGPFDPLMWARFKDTLIGAAVGLVAAFALFGRTSSRRLPYAARQALERTRELFHAVLTNVEKHRLARLESDTLNAVLSMRSLYETALGEMLPPVDDAAWPAVLAIERLAYLVIALCHAPHPQDQQLADAIGPAWDNLIERLKGAYPDEKIPPLPNMEHFPAIRRQLEDLALYLAEPSAQQALT
jgi:uncharacterized membrane protein YccC